MKCIGIRHPTRHSAPFRRINAQTLQNVHTMELGFDYGSGDVV